MNAPVSSTAATIAITGTSAQLGAMDPKACYVLVTSTLAWCSQGASPTASAGAGSFLVPANTPTLIDGAIGAKLALLQHTAGGSATLVRVRAARPL